MRKVEGQLSLPETKYCILCKRKLRGQQSIEMGMGRHCQWRLKHGLAGFQTTIFGDNAKLEEEFVSKVRGRRNVA